MPADTPKAPKYPLLETVLAHAGLQLKGMYTIRDVARIFGVTVRAIQQRVRRGELTCRNLPGYGRFLSLDLEEFLKNSTRTPITASR